MNELASLFGFGLGSWPEPPDAVPLRILGLDAMPAGAEALASAFRARLRQVHPDIAVYENTHLASAAEAVAAQRPEVAELAWARDVLKRKLPPPVTDAGVTRVRTDIRYEPQRCKGCDGTHHLAGGSVSGFVQQGDWRGYCLKCAGERRREARRVVHAERACAKCSRTFAPARNDARYCSPACRQRAYRNRTAATKGTSA